MLSGPVLLFRFTVQVRRLGFRAICASQMEMLKFFQSRIQAVRRLALLAENKEP